MNQRVLYYSDELNDDFAGTNISTNRIDENYDYVPQSPVWKAASFVIYRLIATPAAWLLCRLVCGLKIKNRKVLRQLRGKGFFAYGNHTHGMVDAFSPTLFSFPHKAHIVVHPDAVSIKGLGSIVAMLGAIPIPATTKGIRKFREAINCRYVQGRCITVYPEAHIWPYYTGIRNFPSSSFDYPVKLGAPCIAFATTFRQRRVFKNLPPLMSITLSEPFYPDSNLSERQAKQQLRDKVYEFMVDTASSENNYEYVKYIKTN